MPISVGVSPQMPGFFQMAYVTSNFDRAIREFALTHGISEFLQLREFRFPTRIGREAVCDFAIAYLGPVQFEIVHPIEGDVEVYDAALGGYSGIAKPHHIGRVFSNHHELEAELSRYRALGVEIPIDSGVAGFSRYFYADVCAQMGSYIECCLFETGARTFLESIPRN